MGVKGGRNTLGIVLGKVLGKPPMRLRWGVLCLQCDRVEVPSQPWLLAPQAQPNAPAVLVQVAVLAPVPTALTYVVPPGTAVPLPGTRVLCPLGNREVTGVVMPGAPPQAVTGHTLRPLSEVLDAQPLWSVDLLETVAFCAEYYLAPLGEVARAALPPGLAPKSTRQWALTQSGKLALGAPTLAGLQQDETSVLHALEKESRSPAWLQKNLGARPGLLARLAARGLVAEEQEVHGRARAVTVRLWHATPSKDALPLPPRSTGAAAVDAYLRASPEPVPQEELTARFPGAGRHLGKLLTLQRAAVTSAPAHLPDPYASFPTPTAPAPDQLTPQQTSAVEAVREALALRAFKAFLLEGVTGSGKTEVYLQALADTRAQGRTALILVPEIALTPSLAARFRGRVPGGLAVLHSGLTQSQRLAGYDAARSGRVGAVLGARSAVFAPLWNLGLVVVDEEHDGSYKQDETPRYQGRDLALFRARAAGAVCILGSATPSLESVFGAQQGRLGHLRLTQRPRARPLPAVELVDMRKTARGQKVPAHPVRETAITVGARVPILSIPLKDALTATLAAQQQALIFLNRRGYSSSVLCTDCGLPLSCPHCAVALTHHAPRGAQEEDEPAQGSLRCHYCGYAQGIPDTCPSCAGVGLFPTGLGIQRVDAELRAHFPAARVGRLDRDSVRRKGALEKTLHEFSAGELDILVGTQMLAKGHDFPGVTLVGVVAADMSLRLPDWRAAERTLQILTQVAGRAGRGDVPGRVLIQTYCPEHEALQCAARHDVVTFFAAELPLRRQLGYPPYSRLVLLRAEGRVESQALALAQHAATLLRQAASKHGSQVEILGPAPAPLARIKEVWRFQVLVKSPTHALRTAVMHAMLRLLRPPAQTRLVVDVDPGSTL